MKKNQIKNSTSGITLIALVITIIVMLILVAVTITMAVNGGLFGYAQSAARQTNEAKDLEQELGTGRIKVGDYWYDSPQDYVDGIISANQGEEENDEATIKCAVCDGDGKVSGYYCESCGNVYENDSCEDCSLRGERLEFGIAWPCSNCSGKGEIYKCEDCDGTGNLPTTLYNCEGCDNYVEEDDLVEGFLIFNESASEDNNCTLEEHYGSTFFATLEEAQESLQKCTWPCSIENGYSCGECGSGGTHKYAVTECFTCHGKGGTIIE